jgi:hypothetical protein
MRLASLFSPAGAAAASDGLAASSAGLVAGVVGSTEGVAGAGVAPGVATGVAGGGGVSVDAAIAASGMRHRRAADRPIRAFIEVRLPGYDFA